MTKVRLCEILGNLSLLIFSFIIIAITAGLIFLVFKIKSTAARIILTIILALTALGTIGIGAVVFGLSRVSQTINNAAEEQSTQDKQKQQDAIPQTKDSKEVKDVFATTDVVVGNGVEMEVTKVYTVVDNTQLEYIDDKTYCAVDIRVKNTANEMQNLYSGQFELKKSNGTIISNMYPTDENLQNKFAYFTVELEPTKEFRKSIAFDCIAKDEPLTLEYSGGSTLNFSFFTDGQSFAPIRYQVNFK